MKKGYIVIAAIMLVVTGLISKTAWDYGINTYLPFIGIVYPFRDMVKYIMVVGVLISLIPLVMGIMSRER